MQAARVACPVECQVVCLAACPTWAEQAHQQVAPQAVLAPRLRRSTKFVGPDNCEASLRKMAELLVLIPSSRHQQHVCNSLSSSAMRHSSQEPFRTI